ncbi:hypothetical protein BJ742DRAFT_805070 [Cladochytrium replicatum]|nr:hypothetical protein BJ742DRAFT_805070 [Cladochytrium replicatum]
MSQRTSFRRRTLEAASFDPLAANDGEPSDLLMSSVYEDENTGGFNDQEPGLSISAGSHYVSAEDNSDAISVTTDASERFYTPEPWQNQWATNDDNYNDEDFSPSIEPSVGGVDKALDGIASNFGETFNPRGSVRELEQGGSAPGEHDSYVAKELTDFRNDKDRLDEMETNFNGLIIPETELVGFPQDVLRTTVERMNAIRDSLMQLLIKYDEAGAGADLGIGAANRASTRSRVDELLDYVLRESTLYEQFLEGPDAPPLSLTVDNILGEDIGFQAAGPISPTISVAPPSESGQTVRRRQFSAASVSSQTTTVAQNKKFTRPTSMLLQPMPEDAASSARLSSSSVGGHTTTDWSLLGASGAIGIGGRGNPITVGPAAPTDVFRWMPLRNIWEALVPMRPKIGVPTTMAISGGIWVGTSKAAVVMFDFGQNFKGVLGDPNQAEEQGAVTAISVSADSTALVAGYASGILHIWDVSRQSVITTILPLSNQELETHVLQQQQQTQAKAGAGADTKRGGYALPLSRATPRDGHIRGVPIVHVGFVGAGRNEVVSADSKGGAFYHVVSRLMLITNTTTTRIHGKMDLSTVQLSQKATGMLAAFTSTSTIASGQDTSVLSRISPPTTIFAMACLPLSSTRHVSDQLGLVAIATPYKLAIMNMKPVPQIQYKFAWGKPSETQGLYRSAAMAWFPAVKRKEKAVRGISGDPMLAFSFGRKLHLLRVAPLKSVGEVDTKFAQTKLPAMDYLVTSEWTMSPTKTEGITDVPEPSIVAVRWLNENVIAVLSSSEDLVLVDAKTMKEMERCPLRGREIVSQDMYRSALEPLQMTPERAYTGSLGVYRGRLFVLGRNEVAVGSPLTWTERITAFIRAGNFQEAIALAIEYYNGSMRRSATGLPDDDNKRRGVVGEYLVNLITTYVNMSTSGLVADGDDLPALSGNGTHEDVEERDGLGPMGGGTAVMTHMRDGKGLRDLMPSPQPPGADVDFAHFKQLAVIAFDTCLTLEREDLLFGEIYDRFNDAGLGPVFLELLEPYILDDRLGLPPNPIIMKDLIQHFFARHQQEIRDGGKSEDGQSSEWLTRIEQLILHLDPVSLDIDLVVGLCRDCGLYRALIYVYNRAVLDFVTPFVELLRLVNTEVERSVARAEGSLLDTHGNAEAKTKDADIYTLFVYLAYTLTGKAFPTGTLDRDMALRAKNELYSFLFSPFFTTWPPPEHNDDAGGLVEDSSDEDEVTVGGTAKRAVGRLRRARRHRLGEPPFPYVRLLLRYDSKEFLRVLSQAFDDSSLNGELSVLDSARALEPPTSPNHASLRRQSRGFSGGLNGNRNSVGEIDRQFIIDTLLTVAEGEEARVRRGQDPTAGKDSRGTDFLVPLHIFMAQSVARYRTFVDLPDSTMTRILDVITDDLVLDSHSQGNGTFAILDGRDPDEVARWRKEERQAALMALFSVWNPLPSSAHPDTFNLNQELDKLLARWEISGLWKLCEALLRRKGLYARVLATYVNDETDPGRKDMFFDLAREMLSQEGFEAATGGASPTLSPKAAVLASPSVVRQISEPLFSGEVPSDAVLTYEQISDIREYITGSTAVLVKLIALDAFRTGQLINDFFPIGTQTTIVLDKLKDVPTVQYAYLRALLEPETTFQQQYVRHQRRRALRAAAATGRSVPTSQPDSSAGEYVGESLSMVGDQKVAVIERALYERYIELICTYESKRVSKFLRYLGDRFPGMPSSSGEQPYPYDAQVVLNLCKDHGVIDAAVWILEERCDGDYDGALDLVIQYQVQTAMDMLLTIEGRRRSSEVSRHSLEDAVTKLTQAIDDALDVCQRGSDKRRELKTPRWKYEALWFKLLKTVIDPQQKVIDEYINPELQANMETSTSSLDSTSSIPSSTILLETLKALANVVINAMIGHVDLRLIFLHALASSESKSALSADYAANATFGESKNLLTSLIDHYNYEKELYQATNRILSRDVHRLHHYVVKMRQAALRPARGQCGACLRILHIRAVTNTKEELEDRVFVFRCRHAFHRRCLVSLKEMAESRQDSVSRYDDSETDTSDFVCIICGEEARSRSAAYSVALSNSYASPSRRTKAMQLIRYQQQKALYQQQQEGMLAFSQNVIDVPSPTRDKDDKGKGKEVVAEDDFSRVTYIDPWVLDRLTMYERFKVATTSTTWVWNFPPYIESTDYFLARWTF